MPRIWCEKFRVALRVDRFGREMHLARANRIRRLAGRNRQVGCEPRNTLRNDAGEGPESLRTILNRMGLGFVE